MNTHKNKIQICITSICNAKCKYCFSPTIKSTSKCLTDEQWKIVIDKLKDIKSICGIESLNIVGGEPLLYPDLTNFLSYCIRSSFHCSLTTNGFLLSEQLINSLSGKLIYIGISIDSFIMDTNLRLGRCHNNKVLEIDDVIKISNSLLLNQIPLKINRILSRFNQGEAIEKYFDRIAFNRLKLFQLYINKGINDDSHKYKLNKKSFLHEATRYIKYAPVIETKTSLSDAYYIIKADGIITKSVNGSYLIYGNILDMSISELIALFI